MNVKGAIMFHQYNNVIKIKLTRPAVSTLWIGAAEGNCEGKIILGSRTIALDDINRAILQSRSADLGSRKQFNAAGVVVSACKYHSLLLHLLLRPLLVPPPHHPPYRPS